MTSSRVNLPVFSQNIFNFVKISSKHLGFDGFECILLFYKYICRKIQHTKFDDFTKISLYTWNSLLVPWIGIKCTFLRPPYLASSSEKVNYFGPIQMNFNMNFGHILVRAFFPLGPMSSRDSCYSWLKM